MRKFLLSALLLAAAAPGLAQTAPAAPPPATAEEGEVITVTGNRDIKETVQQFVGAMAPGRLARPLSRFEREVCPMVLGLPQRQADAVAARIRRLAGEVGMKVGGEGCGRNLFVLVTEDKRKLVAEMRRSANEAFGSLSNDKIRALSRQPGSAIVWHSQGPPIGRDGKEAALQENSDGSSFYTNRTTEAASRLNRGGALQFATATVVIERKALDGLSVTQLADYAALRAFTAADPARLGDNKVPTVLRVLDAAADEEVPASLTEWDLAFLDGFYGVAPGTSTASTRSRISSDVERRIRERR